MEERVKVLLDAIEAAEAHLRDLGVQPGPTAGAKGFYLDRPPWPMRWTRVYSSDEAKRRFEILARQIFSRFKALLMEPSAFIYAERHDNLEPSTKTERRDTADVTGITQALQPHRPRSHPHPSARPGFRGIQALT